MTSFKCDHKSGARAPVLLEYSSFFSYTHCVTLLVVIWWKIYIIQTDTTTRFTHIYLNKSRPNDKNTKKKKKWFVEHNIFGWGPIILIIYVITHIYIIRSIKYQIEYKCKIKLKIRKIQIFMCFSSKFWKSIKIPSYSCLKL